MDPWIVIVEMMKRQGVDTVFGLGDTYVSMLAEKAGIRAVNVRHEGAGPFMAMAYSRLTGQIGVCTGSPGPGVANMIPGVLEAQSGCAPLVMPCLVTPEKTEGMGEFQECSQLDMMQPVTKWSARIPRAERIPWFMERAFFRAINGQPGPVYLELPADVVGHGPLAGKADLGPVDIDPPDGFQEVDRVRPAADPERIAGAARMIMEAERPVVVAGNGAVLSRAFDAFREFVEMVEVPFMTTPGGRGILTEDHPLALGLVGLYRTPPGKEYYQGADLLITVGSRNEGFQTHRWSDFPPAARFIQIDIEPSEIGRNWKPDLALIGDARLVLEQLTGRIREQYGEKEERSAGRAAEIERRKREFRAEVEEECSRDRMPILPRRIVYELDHIFGEDAILVNENGGQDTWSYCFPYYRVRGRLGSVPVAEQTCMGMGVVGAIAASLACPERPVVCVTGDGAFQMYMQELATAAQYGAGCTWVILNNSGLGWIRWHQSRFGANDTTTFEVQPDFAAVAEASGCLGLKVEKPEAIASSLKKALKANSRGTPAVIDCIIDPEPDMEHFERAR